MLNVGVNKNLVLVGAKKNDKGTLTVTLKEATDPLAALNGTGSVDGRSQEFFVEYPFKAENSVGQTREADKILKTIDNYKRKLRQILGVYTTSDKISLVTTEGITNIQTGEDLMREVTKQSVLDKMYANLTNQFLSQITPFIGPNGKKTNWALPRQDKNKPYPGIPKFASDYLPFVEPADVPVSKVGFTKSEIKEGLHLPLEVKPASTVDAGEAKAASNLFAVAN